MCSNSRLVWFRHILILFSVYSLVQVYEIAFVVHLISGLMSWLHGNSPVATVAYCLMCFFDCFAVMQLSHL